MTPAKFKRKVKKRQVTASLIPSIIHYWGAVIAQHIELKIADST